MSWESSCECDECGIQIDGGCYTYCESCHDDATHDRDQLQEKVNELEAENKRLKDENGKYNGNQEVVRKVEKLIVLGQDLLRGLNGGGKNVNT